MIYDLIIPAINPVQTSSFSKLIMLTLHFNFPNRKYIFSEKTVTFSLGKTGFKNAISVEVSAIVGLSLKLSIVKYIPKQTNPICAIVSVKMTPGVMGLSLK
jgi:hypothetical protein